MPHINLPEGAPGIIGPMMFRPETAEPLNALVDALLVADNTLTRGERELIASYVSKLNDCHFCHTSHGAFSAVQIEGGWDTIDAVVADKDSAPITEKMKALLTIAGQVQRSGKAVTEQAVAAARAEGATDVEIHDTVLIAAAFCMYNRYVDGLATIAPPDRDDYTFVAQDIVANGYGGSIERLAAAGPPPG